MHEPEWVRLDIALLAHESQIAVHGGLKGVRDHGQLEAAMVRARMKFEYGDRSLASLGAAYAFGLARNHPFADGNKRTALVVMETFLALNGFQLKSGNIVVAALIMELAAGDINEEQLAAWVQDDLEALDIAP
jgi:death on curing protein